MSLSTRAYLSQDDWLWSWVFGLAEAVFGDGHCYEAYLADLRFSRDIQQINAQLRGFA